MAARSSQVLPNEEAETKIRVEREETSGLALANKNVPRRQRYVCSPRTHGKENKPKFIIMCNSYPKLKTNFKIKKQIKYDEYQMDLINYLQSIESEVSGMCLINLKTMTAKHAILINWLIDVHRKLKLSDSILFIAVGIFIRIVVKDSISTDCLQRVACTAFWIACKVIETRSVVPKASQLVKFSGCIFTERDMILTEMNILKSLNFKLHNVDPLFFALYYLRALGINDLRAYCACSYLLHIIYTHMCYAAKRPSLLAAAAVYTVLGMCNRNNLWSRMEGRAGFHTFEDLQETSHKMICELKAIKVLVNTNAKLPAVYKKFSSSLYGSISKVLCA